MGGAIELTGELARSSVYQKATRKTHAEYAAVEAEKLAKASLQLYGKLYPQGCLWNFLGMNSTGNSHARWALQDKKIENSHQTQEEVLSFCSVCVPHLLAKEEWLARAISSIPSREIKGGLGAERQ